MYTEAVIAFAHVRILALFNQLVNLSILDRLIQSPPRLSSLIEFLKRDWTTWHSHLILSLIGFEKFVRIILDLLGVCAHASVPAVASQHQDRSEWGEEDAVLGDLNAIQLNILWSLSLTRARHKRRFLS